MNEYQDLFLETLVEAVVHRTMDLLDMHAELDRTDPLSGQERELGELVATLTATITVLELRERRAVVT